MVDNTRELDQIQQELDEIQKRSNENKLSIATLDALSFERHEHIMKTLNIMHEKINNLENLATSGKSSIRTLWYVGAITGGLVAFVYTIYSFIPR
jgi:hypothetical protein